MAQNFQRLYSRKARIKHALADVVMMRALRADNGYARLAIRRNLRSDVQSSPFAQRRVRKAALGYVRLLVSDRRAYRTATWAGSVVTVLVGLILAFRFRSEDFVIAAFATFLVQGLRRISSRAIVSALSVYVILVLFYCLLMYGPVAGSRQFLEGWRIDSTNLLDGQQWRQILLMMLLLLLTSLTASMVVKRVQVQANRRDVALLFPDYVTCRVARALDCLGVEYVGTRWTSFDQFHSELHDAIHMIGRATSDKKMGRLATDCWSGFARTLGSYVDDLRLPDRYTTRRLQDELTRDLNALLLRHYGELKRTAAGPVTVRKRIHVVGENVRSLVVGVLPLAAILTLAKYGIKLSDQWHQTAVLLTALIAVTTIINLLDPTFDKRLDVSKGVLSVLTGGKDDKDGKK
ncbi:hypothetical protein LWC33_34065 [Pseudonocardia sp. RS11V-5]|uniref:hypothetical protein n=1 Tax=Pseudonocardia terrae TaxID=2905831 RepID=UPI001E4EBDC7|nr:hypothetical protein [Pseudonocardia terrae]MCE3556454.1 hypothetical protein [Pseudonocardia terrae]